MELISLLKDPSVSYADKITAWKKVAQLPEIVRFGLLCAESVLDLYEAKYPNDNRPRLAVEAARQYPNGTNAAAANAADAASAAADAANAAYYAAAYAAYAAAYAADAAANAAYAAANAAYAAANAADAAANAAYAAANAAAYAAAAAAYAANAREKQQQKNIDILIEIYEPKFKTVTRKYGTRHRDPKTKHK